MKLIEEGKKRNIIKSYNNIYDEILNNNNIKLDDLPLFESDYFLNEMEVIYFYLILFNF